MQHQISKATEVQLHSIPDANDSLHVANTHMRLSRLSECTLI
jgi:hypothetical protein